MKCPTCKLAASFSFKQKAWLKGISLRNTMKGERERKAKENSSLPVFSLISHKTLKSAGFILWQFKACFLQGKWKDDIKGVITQALSNWMGQHAFGQNKRFDHGSILCISNVRLTTWSKTECQFDDCLSYMTRMPPASLNSLATVLQQHPSCRLFRELRCGPQPLHALPHSTMDSKALCSHRWVGKGWKAFDKNGQRMPFQSQGVQEDTKCRCCAIRGKRTWNWGGGGGSLFLASFHPVCLSADFLNNNNNNKSILPF